MFTVVETHLFQKQWPPADLSNTARMGHHIAGTGKLGDVCRELASLFLVPVKRPLLLEHGSFNNRKHEPTILPGRITVQ